MPSLCEANPAHLQRLAEVEATALQLLHSNEWTHKTTKQGIDISSMEHDGGIVYRGLRKYPLTDCWTPEAFVSLSYNVSEERRHYEPVAASTTEILHPYSPYCRLLRATIKSFPLKDRQVTLMSTMKPITAPPNEFGDGYGFYVVGASVEHDATGKGLVAVMNYGIMLARLDTRTQQVTVVCSSDTDLKGAMPKFASRIANEQQQTIIHHTAMYLQSGKCTVPILRPPMPITEVLPELDKVDNEDVTMLEELTAAN